jgi:hypothetical protein
MDCVELKVTAMYKVRENQSSVGIDHSWEIAQSHPEFL